MDILPELYQTLSKQKSTSLLTESLAKVKVDWVTKTATGVLFGPVMGTGVQAHLKVEPGVSLHKYPDSQKLYRKPAD
jgi:hypothetical protein